MTLRELCEELNKITYGESSEDPGELAPTVNMSLARLYSDIKMANVYSFYKNEILPITRPLSFHKKGREEITLPIPGRAYGMHISGKGSFKIISGDEEDEFAFDTFGEFFSGVVEADSSICFFGDHSYDVYSLSFYDETVSDDPTEIPTGYPKRYCLTDMIPSFGAPLAMPRDGVGEEIDGGEYIGDCLYLPPDYKGLVVIEYSPTPTRVSELLVDAEIKLDGKYLPHLLHLSAYYALLESDGELAEKHLRSYLAMLPEEPAKKEYSECVKYSVEDGWA